MSQSAATPTKGLSPQVAKESLAYLRRAIEKMKSLQATERVIASLERVMLNRVPAKFELKSLVIAINSLNLALREGNEAKVHYTRDIVNQELEAAFAPLVRRDEVIMPHDLRRFCEGDGSLLDLNSLAALANFYHALPPTKTSRSKYDFVITRLFSSADAEHSGRRRHLKMSREQITKRLTEMCQAWGETVPSEPDNAAQIVALLQQFEGFIAECRVINSLEELVSQSFFQRVRDFKASLGNQLFLPEVTAASVESNITIANRFLSLLEIESEEIREAPGAIHPLAEAFSDTYSNEPNEISRILEELQVSNQQDEAAQARVSRFRRLLNLATKPVEEPALPLTPGAEMPLSEPENSLELLEEFATTPTIVSVPEDDELQAFAAQSDNQELIVAYRSASSEVRKLNLHCFLSPLPDGEHEDLQREGKTRRAALELIFSADRVIQTELGNTAELENDIEARIDKLFDALGQSSDEMRELINITHKHNQNANYEVLLHVYNQLMAVRLRLQSAIVRRSVSEIVPYGSQKEETAPQHSRQAAPETVQKTITQESDELQKITTSRLWRKWVVIIALLLIVGAIGLRLAVTGNKVVLKDDATVVRLTQNEVPGGQMFAEIKLHRDLLLCIVTENWLTLSSHEQKEKLQEVLRFGQERGAVRVLLVDSKGTTVGSATKDDFFVN